VIWDLEAGLSYTFELEPLKSSPCDYCRENEANGKHNLMRIWLNAQHEKILFIFWCLPTSRSNSYIRPMQTDLKGHILLDMNLEFSYWHRNEDIEDDEEV
jgi:hypothetical protein